MKNACRISVGFVLIVSITLTATMCQANDVTIPKKDVGISVDSQNGIQSSPALNRGRNVLERPREGLLWPDWRGATSLQLRAKLSGLMAGFVFIVMLALLQAFAKRDPGAENLASTDEALASTLSALLAAFVVLIITADLYSRSSADLIEIRQLTLSSVTDFVMATGLVLMLYGFNWAFEVYQPHASAKWMARALFWGMLVYTWTYLIPGAGDVADCIMCYKRLEPSLATTSTYNWYTDYTFWLGSFSLVAGLPLLATLAVRSKRIGTRLTFRHGKQLWVIGTVVGAILVACWTLLILYGVLYTGNPSDPIVLGDMTRFFLYHRPRLFLGSLLGLFGLFSALCVLHLPSTKQSEGESVP
jgi:hypothetical protein